MGADTAASQADAAVGHVDSRLRDRVRGYLPVLGAAAVLAAVPLVIHDSRYYMGLAVLMLVFACYAVAFNVIFGSTGQLFLCIGALAGVSAYASAILGNELGLPLALSAPGGILAATALGGLLSWVSVRRHLDAIFVGIVTLAFSLVFNNVLLGQRELTGGETGILLDVGLGALLGSRTGGYAVFLVVLVAFLSLHRFLQRSHVGWAFRALRDDEVAAELAGVDVARYRVMAGVVGSAMLGLVGVLFAHYEGFISPATYSFGHVDVRVIVMLAFGGIGSVLGPVVGAAVFTVVDEALRPLGQLRLAVYGVVLVALFLGFRSGVVPAVGAAVRRLRGHAGE